MAYTRQHAALLRQVDLAVRARDLRSAVALAERGLALGIEHPGLLNLVAHDCIERGRFAQAVRLLERARKLAPDDIHVLNSLGIALKRMGRWQDAADAFDAAIAADPLYANAHFNKGTVLEGLGANDAAEPAYRRAVELEPDFADALGRLSYLAALRGDYDSALALGERAIAGRRGAPPADFNLGQSAHLRGDHEAAKSLARRTLDRDPTNVPAILLLASVEIALDEGDAAMNRLQALIDEPPTMADARSHALGLAGRIYEKRGDAPAAFAAFTASKAELSRLYAPAYVTPEGNQYAVRVARLLQYFQDTPVAPWVARPHGAVAVPGMPGTHVFLVGFPRSGTTLLEKSLAAHPAVATMEEEESFDLVIQNFFVKPNGFARLAALSEAQLNDYREAYWRVCHDAVPGLEGKVFIDKMPLNTIFLSVIAKLFPEAKILFALRDPRDVVLSCLKQQFAMTSAMYEFCTLDSAAHLYDLVMRLGQLYRETLKLQIFDTRYEDMIGDFESAIRRVCGFLGIEWDPSLRDARESSRMRLIRTPSAPQLARGLYDGSGQWRRYREQMAPVLPILAPWVAKFGYPAD